MIEQLGWAPDVQPVSTHHTDYLYIANAEDTDVQIAADTRLISDFHFCSAWEGRCKLVDCEFALKVGVSTDQEVPVCDSGISSMLSVIFLCCL